MMGKLLTAPLSLRRLLLAALNIGDFVSSLKKVAKPSPELTKILVRADKLVTEYEEGQGGYGHIIDVETLTGLRNELKKVPEAGDKSVQRALKILAVLLGEEESGAPEETALPKLEAYGTAEITASTGRPGWYRARLIRAGRALNGLNWKPEVLQAAVESGMFENVPINVYTYVGESGPYEEHLSSGESFLRRVVTGNQVGFTRNVAWDSDETSAWGDVYIANADRRRLIDETLKTGSNVGLGLSIVADGETNPSLDVEAIYGCKGFDFVSYPAADGQIIGELITASIRRWRELHGGGDPASTPTKKPVSTLVLEALLRRAPEDFRTAYEAGEEGKKTQLDGWASEIAQKLSDEASSDDVEAAVNAFLKPGAFEKAEGTPVAAPTACAEVRGTLDDLVKRFGVAESAHQVSELVGIARDAFGLLGDLPNLGFDCADQGVDLPGIVADLVVRASKARQETRTTAGAAMTGEVKGGCDVDEKELKKLIETSLGPLASQVKELSASVGALAGRVSREDSAQTLESAMDKAGIPDVVRGRVRELTAGMTLDEATTKGLVDFASKVATDLAGKLAHDYGHEELLASIPQGTTPREALRGRVAKFLGINIAECEATLEKGGVR